MSYTAQIRIKRDGVQVYQESQTFARKQAAQAWARKRGAELDEPGAIERANRAGITVSDMISRYLDEMEKARPLGKTKRATLNAISETDFGKLLDSELNSQQLVDYALWRMSKAGGGVQPQTAGNDLAHLGAVLSIARPAWGYQVDPHAMGDARKSAAQARLQHEKPGEGSSPVVGRANEDPWLLRRNAGAPAQRHQYAQGGGLRGSFPPGDLMRLRAFAGLMLMRRVSE